MFSFENIIKTTFFIKLITIILINLSKTIFI